MTFPSWFKFSMCIIALNIARTRWSKSVQTNINPELAVFYLLIYETIHK